MTLKWTGTYDCLLLICSFFIVLVLIIITKPTLHFRLNNSTLMSCFAVIWLWTKTLDEVKQYISVCCYSYIPAVAIMLLVCTFMLSAVSKNISGDWYRHKPQRKNEFRDLHWLSSFFKLYPLPDLSYSTFSAVFVLFIVVFLRTPSRPA